MEMYQQNELLPFFIASAILFVIAGFFVFYLMESVRWEKDVRKQVVFAFLSIANLFIAMATFANMIFISGPLILMLPDGFIELAVMIAVIVILFVSLLVVSIQITLPIRQK